MKTFLLTWNPSRWEWKNLWVESAKTSNGEIISEAWSCVSKRVKSHDRVFLVMVGNARRGIIASGWATSTPYLGKHWDAAKATAGKHCQFIDAEWERLLNPDIDEPLAIAELQAQLSGFKWTPQSSGIQIPVALAEGLEKLWAVHVGASSLDARGSDEELSAFEGEQKISMVRHRRREQKLRVAKLKEALQAGGGRLRCEVPGCGFDFFEVYGQIGFEFAHVHHLNALADRATPVATKLTDLAVVCANCHAMIHRGGQCRPLQGLIKS